MTKKIILGGAAGLLTLAAVGGIIGANAQGMISQEAKTAIDNNDYTAFVEAVKNNTTEEKFNKLVEKNQKMEKVQEAINNNDYETFKTVADDRLLERVNSQEEFDVMVQKNVERKAEVAKLNTAIQNNDFEAYKETIMEKVENTDDDKMMRKNIDTNSEEFSTRLEERFNEQVSQYKEDGTLIPEDGGFRKIGGEKFGHQGGKGGMKGMRN